MKIRLSSILTAINILGWVLILIIMFSPSNVLRIILGIPFLLFFPGYTLLAALFIKREGISGVERIALSFGLSIVVVPLIGLILNYTPWGIRLEPVMYSLASFLLITSIIAWLRQKKLAEKERYIIEFQMTIQVWGWRVQDKIFTVALATIILTLLGTLGYFIATPKVGGTFTEFYILGPEGQAIGYPKDLKVGEQSSMIVGITNHEKNEVSYRIEVLIESTKVAEVGSIMLTDGQNMETKVVFIPTTAGKDQKAEFLLFKDDEIEPYLKPLYIWFDVDSQ